MFFIPFLKRDLTDTAPEHVLVFVDIDQVDEAGYGRYPAGLPCSRDDLMARLAA
jgi:hypothetical protein